MEPARVHEFVESLFEQDTYAKRVLSLGNSVLWIMYAASLSIHAIRLGLGLVSAHSLLWPKYSIKQVDRLLSNRKVDIGEMFGA